jgi:hypothetical protein
MASTWFTSTAPCTPGLVATPPHGSPLRPYKEKPPLETGWYTDEDGDIRLIVRDSVGAVDVWFEEDGGPNKMDPADSVRNGLEPLPKGTVITITI